MTPDQRIARLWKEHLRASGVPLVRGRRGQLHLGRSGWFARTITVHGSERSLAVDVAVAITGSALVGSVVPGTQTTMGPGGRPVVFADVTGQTVIDADAGLGELARRVVDEGVPTLLAWATARIVIDRLEADLDGDEWNMDGHRLEGLTVLHVLAGDTGAAAASAARLAAFVSRVEAMEGASPWLLNLQAGSDLLVSHAGASDWRRVEAELRRRRHARLDDLGIAPAALVEPVFPLDLDAPLD